MMRRRMLLKPFSQDLYPIGYDLYFNKMFTKNADINNATGEIIISGGFGISPFLEVNTTYQYTRSYRLYGVYNYDENYNYLGWQAGFNNLGESIINPFIAGTKYIRTKVLDNYVNNDTLLISQDNCWLKRTA